VFGNKVLRKIFGPKRDKVTGERRRLLIEEIYGHYCRFHPFTGHEGP